MRLKTIVISIIAIFSFSAGASVFAADEIEITSGAYYQLGKYNGSPFFGGRWYQMMKTAC